MKPSISSSLVACRKAFNDLIEEIQDSAQGKEGLYLQDWKDERGRLRMWAANIGAHQTGQSSLDFRLRDSSHIQQQVIKLLENLLRRLQDVRTVLAEGEDTDVESIEDSSSEDEASQTEIQQLRGNVATVINCLFEMSILVRKPAKHDIRIGAKQSDVSGYEWADLRHVKDKFPNVDDQLAARLGQAITRRRKYLIYRKRHADKLKQGIDQDIQPEACPTGSDILSETVATDVRTWNVDADDQASESGFSQTSYAPTLISGGAITIPNPPEASHNGTPFECPYCYYVITAPSTKSWNRHVFNDLQPYICTEPRCTTPDKLYTTRHDWVHHVITAHDHAVNSLHKCTLCGVSQSNPERHHQHVARHLQELALFILPRNDDDSGNDGSDAQLGAGSSHGSYSSDRSKGMHDAIDPSTFDVGTENAVLEPFDYEARSNDHLATIDSFSEPQQQAQVPHQSPRPHAEAQLGRVDAVGPPSQEYPIPAAPAWLIQALGRLHQVYPHDEFEGVMRYTAVDIVPLSSGQEGVKHMYYPRIQCKDCPGKMYTPGPGMGVGNFEVHLKNRLHRERVNERAHEGRLEDARVDKEDDGFDEHDEDRGSREIQELGSTRTPSASALRRSGPPQMLIVTPSDDEIYETKTNAIEVSERHGKASATHDEGIFFLCMWMKEGTWCGKKYRRSDDLQKHYEREHNSKLPAGYYLPSGKDVTHETTEQEIGLIGEAEEGPVVDFTRPPYVKVHRKHLSPDTLDAYDLPWEWDNRDSNYIIIKRWINESDQDKLFEHTRRLREERSPVERAAELDKHWGKHLEEKQDKNEEDNLYKGGVQDLLEENTEPFSKEATKKGQSSAYLSSDEGGELQSPLQRPDRNIVDTSDFTSAHRSSSPVYLMYPPDSSGRRPSQHTQLQDTSLAQQEAHERFEATKSSEAVGGSSSSSEQQRPQPQMTRFWYCCNPACSSKGPYIEGLYEFCYDGCGRPKCSACRREVISLRDRPPADRPSARRPKHWGDR